MNATPLSRVLALLALLLVVLNMVAAGMSFQAGVWQKVLPMGILLGGLVILVQLLSLAATGASRVSPCLVWRWVAAFAFFALTFHLLVALFDQDALAFTKQMPREADGYTGVDARLLEVVDVTGPLSAGTAALLNLLLLAAAWLGVSTEDANPELASVD